MRLSDLFALSIGSLWRRKLRTLLTVLGVLIGTTSIVVMLSLGLGANKSFLDAMEKSGTLTRVTLYSNTFGMSAADLKKSKTPQLNDKTKAEIAKRPGVTGVMAFWDVGSVFNGQLMYKKKYSTWANLSVVDLKELEAFLPSDLFIDGEMIHDNDQLEFVMGVGMLSNFMDPRSRNWNPLDPSKVNWKKGPFTFEKSLYKEDGVQQKTFTAKCVGVMGDPEAQYGDPMSYMGFVNKQAVLKIIKKNSALFTGFDPKQYQQMWIKTANMDDAVRLTKELQEEGFMAQSESEYIGMMQEQSKSLQLLLGGIGGVAMIVAAISIANTMLMSIYERTREIGVMKVLGCKLRNILALFLTEAGIIGLVGGIVGLGLSYALSYVLNIYFALGGNMGGMGYGMQSYMPPWLSLVGILFSVVVGMLAGLYPAIRATQLSALEAIRNQT